MLPSQVFSNQPGFRQSFSGSETSTDVSLSSTENLATSQRQEPQGEETQSPFYSHLDFGGVDGGSSYSILARLGMPPGGLDSLGKQNQQQQQQYLNVSATSVSGGINISPGVQPHQNDRYPQNNSANQHMQCAGGSASDILKGISTSDTSGNPPTTSSSVPSPLYSQGHLTVPQWQLGLGHGHNLTYSQLRANEGTARTSHHYPAATSSPSISSRNPAEFSPSSSSNSTLTLMKRMGHAGGGRGGDYSSFISSSSFSSSSSSSAMRSGTSVASSQGLPARMADYASTPSSWSTSGHQYLSPRVPPVSTYHHPHPYVNTHFTVGSGDSTSSSHSSLSTTPVLNTDASTGTSQTNINANNRRVSNDVGIALPQAQLQPAQLGERLYSHSYSNFLPPPPEYPKTVQDTSSASEKGEIRNCRSYEMMDQVADSRGSRPDLRLCASSPGIYVSDSKFTSQSPVR